MTKAHLPSRVELVRLIFGKDLEELRQSAKEEKPAANTGVEDINRNVCLTIYQCRSLPTSSWLRAKPLSSSVKLKPVPTFNKKLNKKRDSNVGKCSTDKAGVFLGSTGKHSLGCQRTGWNSWKSMRNPDIQLRKTKMGETRECSRCYSCTCAAGAKSPLTRHVLIHHVGAMFYKEAKHGGATRSPLQPEENWSLLTGLSIREEHMSTAPPSGNFTSSSHL